MRIRGDGAADDAKFERKPMRTGVTTDGRGPRKPLRRNDNAQEENESLQSIEEQSADIERDVPDVENEPIERDGRREEPEAPIFEE